MRLATKIITIIAIVYNASLGYVVTLAFNPVLVLLFLSLDIFLIFYYMALLIRYNYGFAKYAKEHKELIEDARAEMHRYERSRQGR